MGNRQSDAMKGGICHFIHRLIDIISKNTHNDEQQTHIDNADTFIPTDDNLCYPLDAVPANNDFISQESVPSLEPHNLIATEADELRPIEPVEPISLIKPNKSEQTVENLKPDSPSECQDRLDELIDKLISTVKYYDMFAAQMHNQDSEQNLINDMTAKIVEALIECGCTPIEGDNGTFDNLRHSAFPSELVTDGTPYGRVVRKGIVRNGRVCLTAKVELLKEDTTEIQFNSKM